MEVVRTSRKRGCVQDGSIPKNRDPNTRMRVHTLGWGEGICRWEVGEDDGDGLVRGMEN